MGSGWTHCEWRVEDGVPYLMECAGRMAGGGSSSRSRSPPAAALATAQAAMGHVCIKTRPTG
jgi:hypothetical protein